MNPVLMPNTPLQNRYQIIQLLGQGGMGAVYLAHDLRLQGLKVAIKENFDNSPAAQAQFQTEAAILARLSHPALPRVTDYFIEPSGRQYLSLIHI
jgi:serine/threonine-protein kinase